MSKSCASAPACAARHHPGNAAGGQAHGGAGVFAMPSAVAADADRYSLAVLLAAFVVVALLALCLIEVASRFEMIGGPPVYAASAFGPRAGFAVGWLLALSRVAVFAAISSCAGGLAGAVCQ